MIPDTSYIARSGQKWKVNLSFGFLGVGGLLMIIASFTKEKMSDSLFTVTMLGGGFFGLLWFLSQALTIRCRKCGTNLGWKSLKGQWPIVGETCPECHDDASS